MMPLQELYVRAVPIAKRVVQLVHCFDPGETTGYALFQATENEVDLLKWDQLKSWPLESSVENFSRILKDPAPHAITVFESYQVYSWKTDTHANSDIPTIQVIGCLKTVCIQNKIPYQRQTAQMAKQFVTDEKLEAWGFWKEGMKHSRDAIRHGVYHLIFGHTRP